MTYASAPQTMPASGTVAPRIALVQRALLWLVGAGGAIVFIEPSPYEFATLASLVFFLVTGLRLRLVFMPLIGLMILLNLGYTISSANLFGQKNITFWILTSWYMAITVFFFAMVFSEQTAERLAALSNGLIAGALIAALLGIAGYFNIAGRDLFTTYDRASGTFKDPNVYAAFLALPAMLLLQSVVIDPGRKALRSVLILGIITIAILLAFSRAAWGLFLLSGVFTLFLIFATSNSQRQRGRIILVSIAAIFSMILLVAILLSLDQVQELFTQRASLDQGYDTGRFGRFGRHALGAQMALELPLGIGPLQFRNYFPEDTHNSYLNAFMSGGWISGITYPALILTTVILGFRYLLVRTPWQRFYLPIFAVFLGTVGESFIIDTDHWRHFWLMLGTIWGMIAATHSYAMRRAPSPPPAS